LWVPEVTAAWKAAVKAGDVKALDTLVDAGADVDARDEHGQTALMIAAREGHTPIVRLLVSRGAGLNHTAKFNLSALMLAVLNGRDAIVGVLVDAGADVTIKGSGAPGFDGKTALDLALAANRVIAVALLKDA
jgi:ankyrin repeat protein